MVQLLRQTASFNMGRIWDIRKSTMQGGVNRGTPASGGVFTLKRSDGQLTSNRVDQEVADSMNAAHKKKVAEDRLC